MLKPLFLRLSIVLVIGAAMVALPLVSESFAASASAGAGRGGKSTTTPPAPDTAGGAGQGTPPVASSSRRAKQQTAKQDKARAALPQRMRWRRLYFGVLSP